MTSKLVMDRLDAAGLGSLLAARAEGRVPGGESMAGVVAADMLLLGAAADIARRRELGVEATIYVPCAPSDGDRCRVLRPIRGEGGTAFLRRVAGLRLGGAIGLEIVIDFSDLGVETAQLALAFGGSGLAGPIAARRGLPMAELDAQRGLVKRREITAYVERAGYRPRFVSTSLRAESELDNDESAPVTPSIQGSAHVGS